MKLIKIDKARLWIYIAVVMPLLFSCSEDTAGDQKEEQPVTIQLDTRSLSPGMMENLAVYVFDNHTPSNHRFAGKKYHVTQSGDRLGMSLPAGIWQLGIITCESGDITPNPQFKVPDATSGDMQTSPMWVTGTNSSGFLNQTPEILYVPVRGIDIVSNSTTTVGTDQTTLLRNVAKIEFVLEDYEGFSGIIEGVNVSAFIDLLNVPTTISWEGRYLPSKDSPATSGVALRENLTFKNNAGRLVADTVSFMIPGHREGSDGPTSHQLSFQICMLVNGTPFYGQSETPLVINAVPRANQVIRVIIGNFTTSIDTELDIKISVKDWNGEIDQTEIFE